MKISFDEATGDAILAAVLAAEWIQEIDIKATIDFSQLDAALKQAIACMKELALVIDATFGQTARQVPQDQR